MIIMVIMAPELSPPPGQQRVDLLTLLANWQAPNDYVLEVLSRS